MSFSIDGNGTEAVIDNDNLLLAIDNYEEEEDFWPAYLTWIQKFFASLSIICSYVICREVCSDLKRFNGRRRPSRVGQGGHVQRAIGRILLNLSVADIIFSLAVFLGEWPAPTDTLYIHGAKGNQQFCTFQGWLRALGYLASPMFSVALNAFYLLLIRYRWLDSDLSRLEKKVTIGIWIYALVLSIVPIPLNAYNSDWDVCWIVPSPLDCSDEDCTRGLMAYHLEIYYSYVHIWTCVLLCVVLMIGLFITVKDLEDSVKAYVSVGPSMSSTQGKSTEFFGKSTEFFKSKLSMTKGGTDHSEPFPRRALEPTSTPIVGEQHDSDDGAEGTDDTKNTRMKQVAFAAKGDEEQLQTCKTCDEEAPVDDVVPTGKTCDEEAPEDVEQQPADRTKWSVSALIASVVGAIFACANRLVFCLFPALASKTHRKSRAVAYQGILYTLALLSTHLLDMINSLMWRLKEVWFLNFDIAAYMVLQPSLGILNFLIFCRNRKTMTTPEGRFLRKVVFCCGCFCGLCKCPKDWVEKHTFSSRNSSNNSNSNANANANSHDLQKSCDAVASGRNSAQLMSVESA